jgi:EAL domain-containing protein (putative c-di-GMP-specific phosphodiesterase class I)
MDTSLSRRLFSRTTVAVIVLVLVGLVGASAYTFFLDRKIQSVSLGSLRMASWGLAQLANESYEFDKELELVSQGVGDIDELTLRYDILWSRYNYLMSSEEARFTRDQLDNEATLRELFNEFKTIEPDFLLLVTDPEPTRTARLLQQWQIQRNHIHELMINNFVGDETSNLMRGIEQSRDRLSRFRFITLGSIIFSLLYLLFTVRYFRKWNRINSLTGLPNERCLHDYRELHFDQVMIVCVIRDYQSLVSDFPSEQVEDIIREFVLRLKEMTTDRDVFAHIAPGQFLLMVTLPKGQSVLGCVQAMHQHTVFEWQAVNNNMQISGLFGAAYSLANEAQDFAEYHRYATRALALAQIKGAGLPYAVFDDDSLMLLKQEKEIYRQLVQLFRGEVTQLQLSMAYQPIVAVDDVVSVTGVEALLRCKNGQHDPINPRQIVDICERNGLGVRLCHWVFNEVSRQCCNLYSNLGFTGTISINLNPAMLRPELVQDVEKYLLGNGLPAAAICLEITEDNAALNFDTINNLMTELHGKGIQFALDDFGTGHSSLTYIRELAIDRIKIDRAFVEDIEKDEDKARFLASIIAMAQQAYITTTVVEGIENEHQWQLLQPMGKVQVQGYYAYRPMPVFELMELLATQQVKRQSA